MHMRIRAVEKREMTARYSRVLNTLQRVVVIANAVARPSTARLISLAEENRALTEPDPATCS